MSATDLRARALSGEWRSRMNMRLLLAHSSMCSSSRASPLRARRRQNRRLVSPDTAAPCSVLGGGDPLLACLPVMRSSTFQCGASPLRARGRRPPSLVPPSHWLQPSGAELVKRFGLLAPCGDLLQVWRREANGDGEDVNSTADESHTGNIDIFKVDTPAEKLVKINSLDDHVLILGHNQSLCLSAQEYPQLKANQVYFTDDHEFYIFVCKNSRRDIGVFDLAKNSREKIVSPQLWSNWPPPIWITPGFI